MSIFTGKSTQVYSFVYWFIYPINLFGIWADKQEQSWRVGPFSPLIAPPGAPICKVKSISLSHSIYNILFSPVPHL